MSVTTTISVSRLNIKPTGKLLSPEFPENKIHLKKKEIINEPEKENFEAPLIWVNIISIAIIHILSLYWMITAPYITSWRTILFSIAVGSVAGFGVTAGAHRYWCHRSYKAKLPLQIILMLCFLTTGQNSLFNWVRDHRVHHKYSETDADPHNSKRGFFFSHVGWLMMKKHPQVLEKGAKLDFSDITQDPLVAFQEKYFTPLKLVLAFIIPTIIPHYFWNESWYWCIAASITRYTMMLNVTWLVNSAAHIFGNRPFNKNIGPVENRLVSFLAIGEGWHNYHHTFPWDYKAAELGTYSLNLTTMYLDWFAKIGWAYDLKQPSKETVRKVIENNGDGTHPIYGGKEIEETQF